MRSLIAIAVALLAGLGLLVLDSSPGYDATGITAIGLALAAFLVVLIDGSGRILRVATLAVLVGIWIPVLEIAPPGSYGSLIALAFASAGAVAALVLLRAFRTPPDDEPLPPPSSAPEPPLTPPADDRA